MKESHLWNFIYHHISKNNSVILTAVVDHEEGSPGKEGFKMAVSSSGDFIGSVGGGVMEFDLIKRSEELLKSKVPVNLLEKFYHSRKKNVTKSGLICSGSQTNFTVLLNKKDVKTVKDIADYIAAYKPGKLSFSNKGIKIIMRKRNDLTYVFNYRNDEDWNYEETIGLKNFVYVIGGGHVGLAVSKIMSDLDFHVTVFDDRKDLPVLINNKFANKIITGKFSELGKYITEGNQTYVVIVTKSYVSDKESLMQVISKNVRYIGIMGTKVKIKKIYNEAVKEGISKELLKVVHAPIGIDISSDTPEEIAVSIAAEIIKVKNS
ncbi:MAG: XdhC family protein [Bacteroidetes bacterium]|nr:XdhC family protein [Bacteroidota bacterium]